MKLCLALYNTLPEVCFMVRIWQCHIINARRMRMRVTVVCLSVCYRSTACVGHSCNKMNMPANFAPNSKDFQLRDFAKRLSLTSYSLFFVFSIARSAWHFSVNSQYSKLWLNPLRILLVVMPITIYGYRIQFIGYYYIEHLRNAICSCRGAVHV